MVHTKTTSSFFHCLVSWNPHLLPGSRNPIADALSDMAIYDVQPGITMMSKPENASRDHETSDYDISITSLRWENIPINKNPVCCGISTGRPSPLVLARLRMTVFDVVHGLDHPSIKSTVKLVKSNYVWHSTENDIRLWAKSCHANVAIHNVTLILQSANTQNQHVGLPTFT